MLGCADWPARIYREVETAPGSGVFRMEEDTPPDEPQTDGEVT